MRTEPSSPRPPESLSGLIERVTFHSGENGFAVLQVKAKGQRDLVTVVGSLASVSAGEWVTAEGRWVQDREFGLQFKAEMLTSTAPSTREGIEKYLGSGMVKGIGPERRQRIKDAWAGKKVIRSIMVFLHSNGVSTSRAVRIYKTYGEGAIDKVRADPYYLAKDIHGWHRPPLGRKPAWARPREAGTPSWSSGRGTGARRTFRGPRCQPGLAKCLSRFTGLEARAD